jgi:hypothetical protein
MLPGLLHSIRQRRHLLPHRIKNAEKLHIKYAKKSRTVK